MLLGTLPDTGMKVLFKNSELKEEKKGIRNLLGICKVEDIARTRLL